MATIETTILTSISPEGMNSEALESQIAQVL